jgi:hypothetical protein
VIHKPSSKKVLLIGGSGNQTTIMHQIGKHLEGCEVRYSPFYADGWLDWMARRGLLDFTILAGQARQTTEAFLHGQGLTMDYRGEEMDYDLVVTTVDLVVPRSHLGKKVVLVQEGMMDPENWRYRLVKGLGLPRFLANTSMMGLSHSYSDFCVMSEGYRDLFIAKGVSPSKIRVTGVPNFDNVKSFLDNDFPHRGYVLAATSCLRETLKYENRKAFIRKALRVADGRQLIFKLHPNERVDRATREIQALAPHALIFADGNTDHMIANSDVLVTRYSSVVFVAVALGKEVHADLAPDTLRALVPVQNGGTSAKTIAEICLKRLGEGPHDSREEGEAGHAA